MKRLLLLAWLLLLASSAAISSPYTYSEIHASADKSVEQAYDLIFKQNSPGLITTSSVVPLTGVLEVTFLDTNVTQVCSATPISPTRILTAAHCFCGVGIGRFKVTGYACEPFLEETSARFVSPSAGFRNITKIHIRNEYFSSAQGRKWSHDSVQDLAVAELDRPVAAFAKLGTTAAISSDFIAMVSNGTLAFSDNGADNGFLKNQAYTAGAQQFHRLDRIGNTEQNQCPKAKAFRDTYCYVYAPGAADPAFAMARGCGGDSGGGVFRRTGDGDYELVGVVSYLSEGQVCDPTQSIVTFFVRTISYLDWINSFIDTTAKSDPLAKCEDTLWKAYRPFQFDGSRGETISIVAISSEAHPGPIHLSGATDVCETVQDPSESPSISAAFCSPTKADQVVVAVGDPKPAGDPPNAKAKEVFQVTFCISTGRML